MAVVNPQHLNDLHAIGRSEADNIYFSTSTNKYMHDYFDNHDPKIPDPCLFDWLPTADPGPTAVPTISECAVHLEMLEVFHKLRDTVIQSKQLDAAFGISPNRKTVYTKKYLDGKYIAMPKSLKETGFEERRKPKWNYYLEFATARFHHWIAAVDKHFRMRNSDGEGSVPVFVPPLDVLVVWHAFLLNPDDFKEYCQKKKLDNVQHIVFPWPEIHGAINSTVWTYEVPKEHQTWLRDEALLHHDLFDTLLHLGANTVPYDVLQLYSEKKASAIAILRNTSTDVLGCDGALIQHIKEALSDRRTNSPLVANVERQSVFVDKMHAHSWIRSPAADGTLRRAVDRYEKFLKLFRLYPNTFLVPTLDVDLVWHTHQCSANNYREFVVERVGRFINHEDNISRGTLDNGFSTCEQWYRLRFGEQYQVCLCWYCEAILSAVEEREDVDIQDTLTPDVDALVEQVSKRVEYYRRVEICRRMGLRFPKWEDRWEV